jgi:Uma2 family endonuclease
MAVETVQQSGTAELQARRVRFSVADFYRMGEVGLIAPGERIELIDGELVKMPPIGPGHAGCVDEFADLLRVRLPASVIVRTQNPIRLHDQAEPEPDIAVVVRRPGYYRAGHPTPSDVLLVIEVADSTLAYDLGIKAPLYAAAGIAEYWIVNLTGQQVIVFREPKDGQYQSEQALTAGDAVRPLAFPEVSIAMSDVLA